MYGLDEIPSLFFGSSSRNLVAYPVVLAISDLWMGSFLRPHFSSKAPSFWFDQRFPRLVFCPRRFQLPSDHVTAENL